VAPQDLTAIGPTFEWCAGFWGHRVITETRACEQRFSGWWLVLLDEPPRTRQHRIVPMAGSRQAGWGAVDEARDARPVGANKIH